MNKRLDSDHGIFAESTLNTFVSLSAGSENVLATTLRVGLPPPSRRSGLRLTRSLAMTPLTGTFGAIPHEPLARPWA